MEVSTHREVYMKMVLRFAITMLALIALGNLAWADTAPTLTLDPANGALSGTPGSTVGWGFTIANSTNFLLITSSDFCVGPISSPCSNGLGTYTDFIASNQFVVVGPLPESSSVTQAFDNSLLTGIGSFLINSTANPGDSVSGQIVLTYDLFSVSPNAPNFDPIADTISIGNFLTASASVSVPSTTAPEPGTGLLFGYGLIAFAGLGLAARKGRDRLPRLA
jgi:hypothetical protein